MTNIQILNKLYAEYKAYEIGGVLLGKKVNEDILITNIIFNVDVEKLSRNKYVRNILGIKDVMIDIIEKSNYEVDYIGEWHTHIGISTVFSNIDRKAMIELIEDFPELVLLIKGKIDISAFLFTNKSIRKLTIELTEDI
ncbi:Mov34/MPN/PAD-1 family protein [Sedimentibacter hydroxybenzoicus]|nr:Mov34/MPN/PAD-1 family protein [Sedimentibacter hydroxybenzoicus]